MTRKFLPAEILAFGFDFKIAFLGKHVDARFQCKFSFFSDMSYTIYDTRVVVSGMMPMNPAPLIVRTPILESTEFDEAIRKFIKEGIEDEQNRKE